MGRVGQCMETAPEPLVSPQKPSHPPKLETIREDEEEGEEEREVNVERFQRFLSMLLNSSPTKEICSVMQLAKLSPSFLPASLCTN